jgi:hypothetical protein
MNYIPLIILLFLTSVGLGVSLANHGRARSDEDGLLTLISFIIFWGLIIWGVW